MKALKERWKSESKQMLPTAEDTKKSDDFAIYKADDDKRLVFGWASISITADGEQLEDRQKDMIDPEVLEEAAYEYVLKFRDTGEEHIPTMRKKGKLVESCVLTAEKQKAMGIPEGTLPIGWWIGFKIEDDDAWARVKNGTYKMFSIEGKANREPVEKGRRDYDEYPEYNMWLEENLDATIEEQKAAKEHYKKQKTVAKTFDEILKFNPYHGSDGRFASANSATSFTYAPGKSKAHDMAIARMKEQQAAGGGGQPLRNPTGNYKEDLKREWEGADRAVQFSSAGDKYGSIDLHDTSTDAKGNSWAEGAYGNMKIYANNGSRGQIYMLDKKGHEEALRAVNNAIKEKGITSTKDAVPLYEKEVSSRALRTIDKEYIQQQDKARWAKKSYDTIEEV